MSLEKSKYAWIIIFLFFIYMTNHNNAKDFRHLDQYSDLDAKFRASCHLDDYTKFIDKYVIDISKGLYDPSLWNFKTSAVINLNDKFLGVYNKLHSTKR